MVANHDKAASRRKRGGGSALLPFDFDGVRAEVERISSAAASPEALFEKEWARAVFENALGRLRDECAAAGRAQHYALLEEHDLGAARPTCRELADRFGISVSDVTNRLFASVASCGASSSTCSASWRRTTRSSASRPARC